MSVINISATSNRSAFRLYCRSALAGFTNSDLLDELIEHCASLPKAHPRWMYEIAWEEFIVDCCLLEPKEEQPMKANRPRIGPHPRGRLQSH